MKNITIALTISILISTNCYAQEIPSGRRLRDIMDEKFPDGNFILGGTTGAWTFGSQSTRIMDREFNYVTPENDFKQWNVYPDNSGSFNWTETDAWIEHIEEKGQILRMHCPIGPQCSNWAQDDNRTASELSLNLESFLTAVCARYNDVPEVFSLDVVNEIVVNGKWHGPKPGTGNWENPWTKIGADSDANHTPLYITKAFEIANAYAPDLIQILNHHEHPEITSSWNLIKETVQYLRNKGLRVDGIGWQAHVDNGWATETNLNHLRNLIRWAHDNDLEFHVTEASVWIKESPGEAQLELQAETYRKIVEVLLENRFSGRIAWNTWHIDDASGWNIEWYPSLFNVTGKAKPAYYAIQEVLEDPLLSVREPINNINNFEVYPNPLTESSMLHFALDKEDEIKIELYSMTGRLIKVIAEGNFTPGKHAVRLNVSSLYHSELFILRIISADGIQTHKLVN